MAKIPGTIPLGGTIAPTDTTDVYPTHISNYEQGGVHHVATIAERDAITAERRMAGMLCTVANDGNGNPKIYQLVGGVDNANWQELSTGGGAAASGGVASAMGYTSKQTIGTNLGTLTTPVVSMSEGDAFEEGSATGQIKVKRDCVATIIASLYAPAANGASGDANWNARVIVRRIRGTSRDILAEGRAFVRYQTHTPAIFAPITCKLLAGDEITAEGSLGTSRNDCTLAFSVVEHGGGGGGSGTQGQDGQDGAAATVTVGTVTTLPAGSEATVINSGTENAAVLDFELPQGVAGADGSDHGEPDVSQYISASNLTIPKATTTNVTLTNQLVLGGSGFDLDGGKAVCLRDGVVAIVCNVYSKASATVTETVFSQLNVYRLRGNDSNLVAQSIDSTAGGNAWIYNQACGLAEVKAGDKIYPAMHSGNGARVMSGGVTLRLAYFSANGLSAYELAVKNGFQGTEPEWIDGIEKVLVAEPSYDWQHTVTQDYTQSTANTYTYLEGVASESGMLCAQLSANSTSIAAGTGILLDIDGVRVIRRPIAGPKSGNCLSAPISKGQTFRFGITPANWSGEFLSTAYGPGTGIFIAPVKASNGLLKTYNTTEADTGKVWIDGKPIYRCVVQEEAHEPRNMQKDTWTNLTLPGMPSNIDSVVSAQFISAPNYILNIPFGVIDGGIRYISPQEFGYRQLRVILEYTKSDAAALSQSSLPTNTPNINTPTESDSGKNGEDTGGGVTTPGWKPGEGPGGLDGGK